MFGKRIGTISWTPEIRAEFIQDWTNDKWMKDKGFVKKKNHDEMHDDNDSGRDDISYFTTKSQTFHSIIFRLTEEEFVSACSFEYK